MAIAPEVFSIGISTLEAEAEADAAFGRVVIAVGLYMVVGGPATREAALLDAAMVVGICWSVVDVVSSIFAGGVVVVVVCDVVVVVVVTAPGVVVVVVTTGVVVVVVAGC